MCVRARASGQHYWGVEDDIMAYYAGPYVYLYAHRVHKLWYRIICINFVVLS